MVALRPWPCSEQIVQPVLGLPNWAEERSSTAIRLSEMNISLWKGTSLQGHLIFQPPIFSRYVFFFWGGGGVTISPRPHWALHITFIRAVFFPWLSLMKSHDIVYHYDLATSVATQPVFGKSLHSAAVLLCPWLLRVLTWKTSQPRTSTFSSLPGLIGKGG